MNKHDVALTQLLDIMRQLRDPSSGCPWDRQQTFGTIAPYTIEEAHEVADAIAEEDWMELKRELGDLLFQVVFHSQLAEENNLFGFSDVVSEIVEKMIRRHPHVFGDVFGDAGVRDAATQTRAWEEHKARERAEKRAASGAPSILDGVAKALPALSRAVKLQARAARVGFDWPQTRMVLDKINEEMAELSAEFVKRAAGDQTAQAGILDEFGDLLFVYANLARHLEIDPEEALRQANRKFERRFRCIEELLRDQGKQPDQCTLEELETLWREAKRREKAPA